MTVPAASPSASFAWRFTSPRVICGSSLSTRTWDRTDVIGDVIFTFLLVQLATPTFKIDIRNSNAGWGHVSMISVSMQSYSYYKYNAGRGREEFASKNHVIARSAS